jgi:hypothetical protein
MIPKKIQYFSVRTVLFLEDKHLARTEKFHYNDEC